MSIKKDTGTVLSVVEHQIAGATIPHHPESAIANPYQLKIPNLRACFLPDPGYALVEADLARADAQVIAYEANAITLKRQLANDEDIHSDNAILLYHSDFVASRPVTRAGGFIPRGMHSNGMSYRDNGKRWVHATNFAGKARTVASTIVLPEPHVAACQHWWLHVAHPEIGALHDRIEWELKARKNPVIYNRFGFRRAYVGGGREANLLQQALAWIAQSTVAVVINKAMLAVWRELPEFELLIQIHDSILGQVKLDRLDDALIARLRALMAVTVPYDDSLVIPCEIKWSARSWGDMHPWRGSVTEEAA